MHNDANNKRTLTPDECSALYHIGNVTLRTYLKNHPDCGFIRKYKKRTLIDRPLFEQFLAEGGKISNAKKRRKDQKGQ